LVQNKREEPWWFTVLGVLLIAIGVIFTLGGILFLTVDAPRSAKIGATYVIVGVLAIIQAYSIRRYARSRNSPLAVGASWFVTAVIAFTAAYAAFGFLLSIVLIIFSHRENYLGGMVQSILGVLGAMLFAKRKVVGAWLICIFWLAPIWFLPGNYSYYHEHPFQWTNFAFDIALGSAIVIRFVLGADTRAWLRGWVPGSPE
jgi:uncharacterized membrane protein HdeD (DUF308 family)